MAGDQARMTEHQVVVAAPPHVPYRVIADIEAWPYLFPPTVHAERIAGDDTRERIQLWALANGEMRTWVSRRSLDREACRIDFEQEVTSAPVAAMGGLWTMRPAVDGETAITLEHFFRAIDDNPRDLAWIEQAVDTNSTTELGAVKRISEQYGELNELVLSFADTVEIAGPAAEAYAFIRSAQHWPERLPHVCRVELTETKPGLQRLEMDTLSPEGGTHTTVSFRVCLPPTKIVYKQTVMPPVMIAHTGQWLFDETPAGALVTARHTVVIDRDKVTEILGPAATIDEARARIRSALGANSLTTLRHAKAHAEAQSKGSPRPTEVGWS